ncbi:hypothetical protein BU16DRAFT_375877 [Lophium mytilinum]|uniref:Zn(2)-C6 fungal-type domain-containing protein n=1 Tax=Lophium mytilinum TaxID=390894 RepID=A0A6A6QVA9_9PEZI|nr:hypothetical protein BU16DRAFT_375877 [Lophium mytilinum]
MSNNSYSAIGMMHDDHPEAPRAKRQRVSACQRCRHRKQKCDDERPCSNCVRSGKSCNEPGPQSGLESIQVLTEKLARLEETNSRLQNGENSTVRASSGSILSPSVSESSPKLFDADSASSQMNLPFQPDLDHSLGRNAPAIGLLATFSQLQTTTVSEGRREIHVLGRIEPGLPPDVISMLLNTYYTRIHCRYPFLYFQELLDTVQQWQEAAERRAHEYTSTASIPTKRPELWKGFFVNMVLSIGLLLQKDAGFQSNLSHHAYYRLAVTRFLSHVFAHTERLIHLQAYLLLAMHALHSPSTEKIISVASATMRYCVMAHLHLAEREPDQPGAARVRSQIRRRVFWSAYALDRVVGTMFDLPFSVPDDQITVSMYANVDDSQLWEWCNSASREDTEEPESLHTSVSYAMHVVYCRQLQSEILNHTLHRDFETRSDHRLDWRQRILDELDQWKSSCHRFADAKSKSYTSGHWLGMIYNFSLAILFRPTKSSVRGPAGDWTVKACTQACLTFRKLQREGSISEPWMGLIGQFKCGITLLYCFFATPPAYRTDAFDSPDTLEAIRACSNILSIIAERWPQSQCLRDVFDIVAREIPLVDRPPIPRMGHADYERGAYSSPQHMREDSAKALEDKMAELDLIVVHRDTLRMLDEMMHEDFPRPAESVRSEVLSIQTTEHPVNQQNSSGQPGLNFHVVPARDTPVASLSPSIDHFMDPSLELSSTMLGFPGEFEPGW